MKIVISLIFLVLLPLANIASAERGDPTSFSECLLKYMTGAQSDYGARAIESACREVFPAEQEDNKQAEEARCAPIKKTLTDWDAYIQENFGPKAIKEQTRVAILGGMARGGVNGSRQAQANLNRNIANNKRANAKTRLEIIKEIRVAGC
jgi:hypothetical protein